MRKNSNKHNEYLISYGRRLGRKLTAHQQELLDNYLPQLLIDVSVAAQTTIDIHSYFGNNQPIWLEIGFGAGEHLLHMAQQYPNINFIGAEPFYNGVAKLLNAMQRHSVNNIRIVPDDVRPLLASLPADTLSRIYILFPDPWPKARHHKRRLINNQLLDMIANILHSQGQLRIATDHYDYSAWIMEHILPRQEFVWCANNYQDWQIPPDDWAQTRYERKAIQAGRYPVYLQFIRI